MNHINEMEDRLDSIGDTAENANYEGNILDTSIPDLRNLLSLKFEMVIPVPNTVPAPSKNFFNLFFLTWG